MKMSKGVSFFMREKLKRAAWVATRLSKFPEILTMQLHGDSCGLTRFRLHTSGLKKKETNVTL